MRKGAKGASGSFGKYLTVNGLSEFKLSISIIPNHLSRDDLHMCYELMLFLKLFPKFNDLYIPNTISGAGLDPSPEEKIRRIKVKGRPLYLYTEDNNNLIYAFHSLREAGRILNCGANTISNSISANRSLFGLNFKLNLLESIRARNLQSS